MVNPQKYQAGKPIPGTEKFSAMYSEQDGNYAGGETRAATFTDFEEAYIYALGIEAYFKPLREASRKAFVSYNKLTLKDAMISELIIEE
jgi:hypothetical protein